MAENQPTLMNCPTCGAPLEYDGIHPTIRCKFCGNVSMLPSSMQGTSAPPAAGLDEVARLATGGNLIEAIKKYRQIYNVGLAEAKQAVEALQQGRMVTPSAAGTASAEEQTRALEQVRAYLAQGNKAEAIKAYREIYDVAFERAKYAVEQIERGQTAFPEAGFTAAMQMEQVQQALEKAGGKSGKKSSRVGCIVGVVLVLFLAGVAAFVLYISGSFTGPHYYSVGPVVEVASADEQPDFVTALYNPNKDARFVGMADGSKGSLTWHGEKFPDNGIPQAIVAGTDLVYVGIDTDLFAYKKGDGSIAWQTKLPDQLAYGDSSIIFTSGVVITITNDQSMQAFNAGTGAQVWSRRLLGYDRTLRLMGASLVVVDPYDDTYDYALFFLDPATGNEQAHIIPTCTYQEQTFEALRPDSGLVYDQDANALYLLMNYSYTCLERYSLIDGSLVWQTINEDIYFNPSGIANLQTAASLYFETEQGLYALDKNTGATYSLIASEDYDFIPLEVTGDNLLVRAQKTRGTSSFELWAVNGSNGSLAWKIDLQGAEPIEPPNEMAGLVTDTDHGFTWRILPDGLMLFTFKGEPNQLVMEKYDLESGNSLGQQVLPLKTVTGDFYQIPEVISWHGNVGYFVIDTSIYSIDVTAGKVKKIY